MSARPLQPKVNLLPSDRFEFSKLGRFLSWALSTGRYVVVLTELVVIIAFVSRFWFDRQLTDLREVRMVKSAIVESQADIQAQFERTVAALAAASDVIDRQYNPAGVMENIQSLTPVGVEYTAIEISSESAKLVGFAPGSTSFSQLLALIQQDEGFTEVEVGRLGQSKKRSPGFDFELKLRTK